MIGACFLALAAQGVKAVDCVDSSRVHECFESSDRAASCESAVSRDARDIDARLALCEAYVRLLRFDDAVGVLNEGFQYCGKTKSAKCRRLLLAKGNVEERKLKEERKLRNESPRFESSDIAAKRQFCLLAISSKGAIEACEAVLVSDPSDSQVEAALGKKILKVRGPLSLLARLKGSPNQQAPQIREVILEAQGKLEDLVVRCEQGSLSSCSAALDPGGPSESRVLLARSRIRLRSTGASAAKSTAVLGDIERLSSINTQDPSAINLVQGLRLSDFPGFEERFATVRAKFIVAEAKPETPVRTEAPRDPKSLDQTGSRETASINVASGSERAKGTSAVTVVEAASSRAERNDGVQGEKPAQPEDTIQTEAILVAKSKEVPADALNLAVEKSAKRTINAQKVNVSNKLLEDGRTY